MPQTEKQQIGRYEILQEIGRGAMGVVFKGRDPLIGRAVAVKTITSGVAESADLLERFYREARAAGGLQHPNIVTIYELAESGGAPFIAMEYLEGESLEKIIARKPALPLATKLGYVIQTCRALDYAHRRGVIHRDVKPANIVVTRDGMVKVVDFGIARLGHTSNSARWPTCLPNRFAASLPMRVVTFGQWEWFSTSLSPTSGRSTGRTMPRY